MPNKTEPFIPRNLHILHTLGAILIGLGIAENYGDIGLVPAEYRFQGYAFVLIVAGIGLMVPALVYPVRKLNATRRAGANAQQRARCRVPAALRAPAADYVQR